MKQKYAIMMKSSRNRLSADRLRADYRQATHRLRQATDRFLKRKVCCRKISQQSADRRPAYGRNVFSGAVLLNYPISCNRQESPLTSFSGVKTTTNSPNLHNKTKRWGYCRNCGVFQWTYLFVSFFSVLCSLVKVFFHLRYFCLFKENNILFSHKEMYIYL